MTMSKTNEMSAYADRIDQTVTLCIEGKQHVRMSPQSADRLARVLAAMAREAVRP